jgi:hypothetical protein
MRRKRGNGRLEFRSEEIVSVRISLHNCRGHQLDVQFRIAVRAEKSGVEKHLDAW